MHTSPVSHDLLSALCAYVCMLLLVLSQKPRHLYDGLQDQASDLQGVGCGLPLSVPKQLLGPWYASGLVSSHRLLGLRVSEGSLAGLRFVLWRHSSQSKK